MKNEAKATHTRTGSGPCLCLTPAPGIVCRLYRVSRIATGRWGVYAAIAPRFNALGVGRATKPAAIETTKQGALAARRRLTGGR
jgi:hypothetical protein